MTDQARWKATVYIGGLSPMVNIENLQAAFLPFGEITDVSIPWVSVSSTFISRKKADMESEKTMPQTQWNPIEDLAM